MVIIAPSGHRPGGSTDDYCRVWAVRVRLQLAPCNIIARLSVCVCVCVCVCLSVCLSVCLFAPWMHEFQTAVWMEAPRDVPSKASRPVLSSRGRPLPASGFHGFRLWVRESIHWRARAPISWVVVAHSVPGRLNCFYCSLELVRKVCWARFPCKLEALRSVHHVHVLVHPMVHAAFAGSPPARFDYWSRWSIQRFQLSPVKPLCLKPSDAPRQSPLLDVPSPDAISRYTQVFLWELGSAPPPPPPPAPSPGKHFFTDFTFATLTQASSHA